jgi:hypothetical protein
MITIDELGIEISGQTVALAAGDFILDVDRLIAETVVLLNKKGYKTISSCQGHPGPNSNSYIEFREQYTMPMPKGYKKERLPLFIRKYFHCVNDNYDLQRVLIRENANELHRWAMGLPDISG